VKDSPNLDLLRAIAVLLVVGAHVTVSASRGEAPPVRLVGQMGVVIFFVHTCLVLLLSMQRRGAAPIPFYVRRLFRIYPLSVVVVLLISIGRMASGLEVNGWQIASNLLLIQNITGHESRPFPLWSLAYEVQMYLVLPFLLPLARRHGPHVVALLQGGMIVLIFTLQSYGAETRLLQWVPGFLSGVLAYSLTGRVRPTLRPGVLFLGLALALSAALALRAAGVPNQPLYWGVSLVLGVIIPRCREIAPSWLASSAHLIATYSYGIYLTHIIALDFAFSSLPGQPMWMKLALFVLALLACSRVAYRYVEAPAIAIGAKLASRLQMRQPQVENPTRA
jgi:peptidoglycan/LPS O-acetylase OafA/YrhL